MDFRIENTLEYAKVDVTLRYLKLVDEKIRFGSSCLENGRP